MVLLNLIRLLWQLIHQYDPDQLVDHLHPARSYVLGLYVKDNFPDGLFVDFDPVPHLPHGTLPNGEMIIVRVNIVQWMLLI